MPYNWSRPARGDRRRGFWDPSDDRIITPKNYGWGYAINFAAILGRLQSHRRTRRR